MRRTSVGRRSGAIDYQPCSTLGPSVRDLDALGEEACHADTEAITCVGNVNEVFHPAIVYCLTP